MNNPNSCRHDFIDNGEFLLACTDCGITINTEPERVQRLAEAVGKPVLASERSAAVSKSTIFEMSIMELLALTLNHPDFLTDSYHSDVAGWIGERYEELCVIVEESQVLEYDE